MDAKTKGLRYSGKRTKVVSELSEQELAGLCVKGDAAARRELYTRYAARLCSLCRRYLPDDASAQDMMHDVMIKAFGKIGRFQYRGEGSLYSWLARMAVNMSIDSLRKARKFKSVDLEAARGEEAPEPDVSDMRKVPRDVLMRFISELPDTKRTIFNLYYIEEVPHKEIARMLGIRETSSTSLLARARRILAENINDYLKKTE